METFEEKLPGPPIRTFSGDFGMPSPEVLEHVALICDAGLLESNCDPLRDHVYVIKNNMGWIRLFGCGQK